MTTQETIDQFEKHVIANYGRLPRVIVKGQGCYLYDADGNESEPSNEASNVAPDAPLNLKKN